MFLNPPSLPELRMWAQVKCSHRKPSSASIGRLHDLQISFEDHESGRRYRCLPFPLYSYLLNDVDPKSLFHIMIMRIHTSIHDFLQVLDSDKQRHQYIVAEICTNHFYVCAFSRSHLYSGYRCSRCEGCQEDRSEATVGIVK